MRSTSRTGQCVACKSTPLCKPAGATGLENLGNTCFMNVVLQVLAHMLDLVTYLVSEFFRDDLNKRSPSGGDLAEEVAQVVAAVWSGKFRFVSPHRLRAALSERRLDFGGMQPHDAHEFIILLLEWLHDDLNVAPGGAGGLVASPSSTAGGLPDHEAADRAWRQFRRANDSIIVRLFHGLQKSSVLCAACGFESATFETFSVLSLPLPAGAGGSLDSLYHCLEQYIRGDLIKGWSCTQCHRRREVYKKLDLWRLPLTIIFHLKRFSFTGGLVRKVNGHVSFPLRDLDLSQLVIGPHPHSHGLVYDLCGVVEHHGSQQSGHYTAFCFNQPVARWFFMNDKTVEETSTAIVKKANAYMLCYTAREEDAERKMAEQAQKKREPAALLQEEEAALAKLACAASSKGTRSQVQQEMELRQAAARPIAAIERPPAKGTRSQVQQEMELR